MIHDNKLVTLAVINPMNLSLSSPTASKKNRLNPVNGKSLLLCRTTTFKVSETTLELTSGSSASRASFGGRENQRDSTDSRRRSLVARAFS